MGHLDFSLSNRRDQGTFTSWCSAPAVCPCSTQFIWLLTLTGPLLEVHHIWKLVELCPLVAFRCPKHASLGTFGPAARSSLPEDCGRRNRTTHVLGRHTWRSQQCGSVRSIFIATKRPVRHLRTCCRRSHAKSCSIPPFDGQEICWQRRKAGWGIDRAHRSLPKLRNWPSPGAGSEGPIGSDDGIRSCGLISEGPKS